MEQFTPSYHNTTSDGFINFDQSHAGLTHLERYSTIELLMSTADLSLLAQRYFQHVQKFIKLEAIVLQYDQEKLELGTPATDHCCTTLLLQDEGQHIASIHYYHNKGFSQHGWQCLHELHNCSKWPFKHAIERQQLKRLVLRDHLTHLGNRASYEESIQRLLSQSERQESSFGLLVLDLDKFKSINDNLGHQQGDLVLAHFADVLTQSLRDTDFAFRLGGDEFCCLLQDADMSICMTIAQRIQKGLSQHTALTRLGISCSIGSATYNPGDSASSIFERADRALYQAKSAGRDCIKSA